MARFCCRRRTENAAGDQDNLELEGYEVELAADGKTGLQLLLEHSFDLALLDVMMPAMSGFDVCRRRAKRGYRRRSSFLPLKEKRSTRFSDWSSAPTTISQSVRRAGVVGANQGGVAAL